MSHHRGPPNPGVERPRPAAHPRKPTNNGEPRAGRAIPSPAATSKADCGVISVACRHCSRRGSIDTSLVRGGIRRLFEIQCLCKKREKITRLEAEGTAKKNLHSALNVSFGRLSDDRKKFLGPSKRRKRKRDTHLANRRKVTDMKNERRRSKDWRPKDEKVGLGPATQETIARAGGENCTAHRP